MGIVHRAERLVIQADKPKGFAQILLECVQHPQVPGQRRQFSSARCHKKFLIAAMYELPDFASDQNARTFHQGPRTGNVFHYRGAAILAQPDLPVWLFVHRKTGFLRPFDSFVEGQLLRMLTAEEHVSIL